MYYCHTYSILPLLLLSLPKKASSIPGELSQDSTLTGPRLYAVKWQQVNVIPYFYVNDILTEYGTSTALISAGFFHFALKASLCTSTPSALHYGKLSFANCGFQTSWPMAFWLGRANRRPWNKIGGETKGENRMLLPLSASGDISGSDSTSLWLLPETPFHLWSDTSQAAPPLCQLLWRSPRLDHTCSPCPSWSRSGRSFLHLLNSGLTHLSPGCFNCLSSTL